MQSVEQYREAFDAYLEENLEVREPSNLYKPMVYILGLGGKRIRPVLVLMAAEIFGGDYKKALDASLAIEIFHNFSLVHDDIMDDAPLRRGEKTVHELWDVNTAILSGDAMLINAYRLFENYEAETFRELAKLFSRTAIEVCEGQQYDIDFETNEHVSVADYLKMIDYKTAVLVGASLQMGAIVANASQENQQKIYEFGRLLGMAFQLQDDYLDAFGNPETFGKQVGGDIIENKKTFLYLKSVEKLGPVGVRLLEDLYSVSPYDPSNKVHAVIEFFQTSGADRDTKQEIESYTTRAFEILDSLDIESRQKQVLRSFGLELMDREA